uniref:Uncharacterized protein n=1 Tax=viral metagenome TaxID=1070528 RepID=A0A6H1ZFS2_9ZZZZ
MLEIYERIKEDRTTDLICGSEFRINQQSPLFCKIKGGYCNKKLCMTYQAMLDKVLEL